MHADRRMPVVLLAVLYAVSGALCLVGGRLADAPRQPVALLLGGRRSSGWPAAPASAALGVRTRWWAIHAAVALGGVLIGLLAWRSVTAVGIVGLGPALIGLGLYAAHFFPLGAARLHVLGRSSSSPRPARSPPPRRTSRCPGWCSCVATLTLTEAQGRLAQSLRTAATTDPLTGVANRRAWEAEARATWPGRTAPGSR